MQSRARNSLSNEDCLNLDHACRCSFVFHFGPYFNALRTDLRLMHQSELTRPNGIELMETIEGNATSKHCRALSLREVCGGKSKSCRAVYWSIGKRSIGDEKKTGPRRSSADTTTTNFDPPIDFDSQLEKNMNEWARRKTEIGCNNSFQRFLVEKRIESNHSF